MNIININIFAGKNSQDNKTVHSWEQMETDGPQDQYVHQWL